MRSMKRREFFSGVLLSLIAFTGVRIPRLEAAGGPVSEADPTASALGYKHDASKVDLKKFPQRGTPAAKTQFCDNCMFYTNVDGKSGKCQLIQTGTVNPKGWCVSWAKK